MEIGAWFRAALLLLACAVVQEAASEIARGQRPGAADALASARALHDAGKYREAIGRYEKLLQESPGDAVLSYELALSASAAKEYERCIEHATRGGAIAGTVQAIALALLGSCQDDGGKAAAALATFAKALERFPTSTELNVNYAIALARKGKHEAARERLRAVMQRTPDHASSYFLYAHSLEADRALGAAISMYLRFLMLDRETARATDAAKSVVRLMYEQVQLETRKVVVARVENVGAEDPELLTAMNLAVATTAANTSMSGEHARAADKAVAALLLFLQIGAELRESKDGAKSFALAHTARLQTLLDANVADAFLYRVAQLAQLAGAAPWLERNDEATRRMLQLLAAPATQGRTPHAPPASQPLSPRARKLVAGTRLGKILSRFATQASPAQHAHTIAALSALPALNAKLDRLATKGSFKGIELAAASDPRIQRGPVPAGAMVHDGTLIFNRDFLSNRTSAELVFILGHMAQHLAAPLELPAVRPTKEEYIALRMTDEATAFIQGWNDLVEALALAKGSALTAEEIETFLVGFRYGELVRRDAVAARMGPSGAIELNAATLKAIGEAMMGAQLPDYQ